MAETHDRLIARLAKVLADLHDLEAGSERVCEAGRHLLGADGAALSVQVEPDVVSVVAATDELAAQLEDLQEVVGEGPSRDALRLDAVQIADFTEHGNGAWSVFHEQGSRLGFSGGMIAVPLRPHARVIGTLSGYRSHASFGIDPADADFLGVALGAALLQASDAVDEVEDLDDAWSSRSQIHQATGMIIAQVGVRPEDALALLRGQAFALGTSMVEVASQIVQRRINFRNFTIEGD